MYKVQKIYAKRQVANALNTRNGLQVDSVHNLSINLDMFMFYKGNVGYIGKQTGLFKLLGIVNKICKISLLFGPIDFRSTVIKLYLIKPKDNDPNNTSKTKYDNQKNSYKEDLLPISCPITVDLIPAVVVAPSPIFANLLISLLNNHDCKAISLLPPKKNSNQSFRNSRVWRVLAYF